MVTSQWLAFATICTFIIVRSFDVFPLLVGQIGIDIVFAGTPILFRFSTISLNALGLFVFLIVFSIICFSVLAFFWTSSGFLLSTYRKFFFGRKIGPSYFGTLIVYCSHLFNILGISFSRPLLNSFRILRVISAMILLIIATHTQLISWSVRNFVANTTIERPFFSSLYHEKIII